MKYVTDYSNRDNWMHFADNPVYDVDISRHLGHETKENL